LRSRHGCVYERIRCLVLEPGVGETLLDIALQRRPPESIIEAIVEPPDLILQQVVTRS
jgi:hypothetical protein